MRQEEGDLARELEALETGQRLGMHDSDWESLVGLAHRHGWRPSAGSDHYLRGKAGRPPFGGASPRGGARDGLAEPSPRAQEDVPARCGYAGRLGRRGVSA